MEKIKYVLKVKRMEVVELFKDALKYPSKDWGKVLTLGFIPIALLIILGIAGVIMGFGIGSISGALLSLNSLAGVGLLFMVPVIIAPICYLLIILVYLFYEGYLFSIIKKTVSLDDEVPSFDWKRNIYDGLKLYALVLIYSLIPNYLLVAYYSFTGLIGSVNPILTIAFGLIGGILVLILGAIYVIILSTAIAKLGETDSLYAALDVRDVISKVAQIGWGNYIKWVLGHIIINFVLGLIASIFAFILLLISGVSITSLAAIGSVGAGAGVIIAGILSLIGFLIGVVLILPYYLMFFTRSVGLIYNELKN
jgi:hypothetical protein